MQQAGKMPGAVPDAALDAAYRRTQYEVQAPAGFMLLRIDVANPALLAALRQQGVGASAFLTAWNPRSIRQPAALNELAHRRLCERIAALRLGCWPAWARAAAGDWPAEQGVFVPGLERDGAAALAAEFGQNAFVLAGADAVPRLVWVRRSAGSDRPAAPGTATSGS